MSTYKERFIDAVVKQSVSEDWSSAKTEWYYTSSYEEHGSNCVCGQSITEVCIIRNRFTNNIMEVGNKCVQKFMYDDRESEFKLLNKNKIDNALLIELGLSKVITQWDITFYINIKSKRKLSTKQLKHKSKIIEAAKHYVNETKQKENSGYKRSHII